MWPRWPAAPLLAFALALAASLATAPVRADPPARAVSEAVAVVRDGGGCVDRAELATAVARWLRRDAVDARVALVVDAGDAPEAPVTIAVARDGDVVAERRFEQLPRGCDVRRAALALLVALAIDATLVDFRGAPPPAPPPAQPTRAHARTTRATAPPPPPSPAWSLAAAFAGGAWLEVVPGLAGAGYGGLELGIADWLLVRLGALAGAGAAVGIGRGAADIVLVAGRLDACLARRVAPRSIVALSACAGAAAGPWRAQGRGFDTPLLAYIPWVAIVGRVGARFTLGGPVALTAAIDAVIPVLQPTITVIDAENTVLHARSVAPVGGAAEIGLAITFR